MSSKAVTVRLKRVSQLRRLCVALGKSKAVRPEVTRTSKEPTGSSVFGLVGDVSPTEGSGSNQ
jgi:hypothetical protein